MKLTKIIATIGPASESEEKIEELIENGVNIFRFNFKHNDVDWHGRVIDRVRKVARRKKTMIGILMDLQGPEIRTLLPGESLEMNPGDLFELSDGKSDAAIAVTHPSVIGYLEVGQQVFCDDGAFEFEVIKKGSKVFLKSKSAGVLGQRKTMNIPGANFPFPVLTKRDYEGLNLAAEKKVDFIGLSFVRSTSDILFLKKQMKKINCDCDVVPKIETPLALEEIDEIIEISEGLMVARGDLGVEMPVEQVPFWQKEMIAKCTSKGKFVITATQMLESMISNPFPTRAEVSDVANATYDQTDCVMLSGETASGRYPVEAVKVMSKTSDFNEKHLTQDSRLRFEYSWNGRSGLVCSSAYDAYLHMNKANEDIQGIVVFTTTGRTARIMSSFKPNVPIFAFCLNRAVATKLTAYYGVFPLVQGKKYKEKMQVKRSHVLAGVSSLKEKGLIKLGDKCVALYGDLWSEVRGTSTMKILTVE